MKVCEIMTKDVRTVTATTTLEEAARMMRELDVGALPVCAGDKLEGMVTDRDITTRATAFGVDPKLENVGVVMSNNCISWCYEDQDVAEVAENMAQSHVRRLPVLDHAKHLVGIVSVDDLATHAGSRLAGKAIKGAGAP